MANQTPALICGTGKWPFGTIFWQIPRMYGLRQAKQDQGQEVPAPALEQETTTHLPSIPRPRASRTPTSDHKGQEGEGDALSLPPGRSPNQSKAGARGRGCEGRAAGAQTQALGQGKASQPRMPPAGQGSPC